MDAECRVNALRLIQSVLFDSENATPALIHEAREVVRILAVLFSFLNRYHSYNKAKTYKHGRPQPIGGPLPTSLPLPFPPSPFLPFPSPPLSLPSSAGIAKNS